MTAISRTKPNQQNIREQPRRFGRQKQQQPGEQYYSEGVQSIIDHRRLIEVKTDTILLAVDIFRSYLNKGGAIAKATITPLCIGCILIASKVNEIFPAKIDDVAEAFDYFASRQELIKMEAWVLKICEYDIPFADNLIHFLEQKYQEDKAQNIQQAVKIIFRCISDPFFLKIENKTFASSLAYVQLSGQLNKKPLSKQVATVVHYIKQKYETVKASALGARDLNTIK